MITLKIKNENKKQQKTNQNNIAYMTTKED